MRNNLYKIFNIIYPQKCYLCDVIINSQGLCNSCLDSLKPTYKYSCSMCGVKLYNKQLKCLECFKTPKIFDTVSFCYVYDTNIFKIINSLKNSDNTNLVNFFSYLLVDKIKREKLTEKIDIIIPIPIHYFKLFRRKYNHMSLVGRYIAKHINKPCYTNVLKKRINTKNQMQLDGRERLDNLKGVFQISKNSVDLINNSRVLLIDDVLTTGSTINECSKVLQSYGAKEIHVICFSRVQGNLKV